MLCVPQSRRQDFAIPSLGRVPCSGFDDITTRRDAVVRIGVSSRCRPWSDALNTGSPRVVEVPTANSEGFRSTLEATGAEVLLSTFYGEIVDTSTLNVASIGCVNIHPSLLPALRGTNPVFWALAEGLSTTGLTAHEMVKEFDAGGIVCQLSVPVDGGDTHHELYRRIVETASPRLEQALATIGAERSITTVEQDRSLASTFSKPDRHAYASMLANGHRFL